MRALRIGISAGALACGILMSSAASAQAIGDDYWLQIYGWNAKVDTDVRVSDAATPDTGTEIDLEDDLSLDDDQFLPSFAAGASLGGGFSVNLDYYAFGRDSTATLSRNITVDDVVYPANASITAGFDTDVYRLTINWAFVRQENFEMGAGIGLHATDLAFTLEGQGSVGGAPVSLQQRAQDVLAPLPTVGLFANLEVSEGLTLGGRIDFLSLSVDDYDGRLINTQVQLAYRFTRNFGAGVMYRYVDYRLDVEKDDYVGRFSYEFNGPAIFIEAGF